jgi:hypothetical protein
VDLIIVIIILKGIYGFGFILGKIFLEFNNICIGNKVVLLGNNI